MKFLNIRALAAFILCPVGIFFVCSICLQYIYFDCLNLELTSVLEGFDILASIVCTVVVGFVCAKIVASNPYIPVLLGAIIYTIIYGITLFGLDFSLIYKIFIVSKVIPSVFLGIYLSERFKPSVSINSDPHSCNTSLKKCTRNKIR